MSIADQVLNNKRAAYDANVRTFANGRGYEFQVDFNQDAIDVARMTNNPDANYFLSDVANVLIDFVEAGESYRVLNATEAFIKSVRREAKRRALVIWFGLAKDQYGNPVNCAERLLTLRDSIYD